MSRFNGERGQFARFLVVLAGVCGSLFILLIGLNWVAADRVYTVDYQITRFRNEMLSGRLPIGTENDIVVVGDSTAQQALLVSRWSGFRAVSLAISGGGIPEAYYVYSRYKKRFKPPKCVVLMTSYGAFDYHKDEKFWQFVVANQNLTVEEALDYRRVTAAIPGFPGDSWPAPAFLARFYFERIRRFANWNTLQMYWLFPHLGSRHPARSYRSTRLNFGAFPIARGTQFMEVPFDGPNQAFLKKPFEAEPVLDLYLQKLIEEAAETGTRVILFYGPIAASLKSPASEDWMRRFNEHIAEQTKDRPHVDNRIQAQWWPDIHFLDGTHLFEKPAQDFQLEILPHLESCRGDS